MHKPMTSTTQPRHAIQHFLRMPSSFPDPFMRRPRYQMVICRRHPVAQTELAVSRARRAPDGWGRCDGGDVGV